MVKELPFTLRTSNFDYSLPESRIADKPLEDRDQSKLLHYNNGRITHLQFREIPGLLPEDSALLYNDTRVIPARIEFFKDTGGRIELFCLEPAEGDMQTAFEARGSIHWKCLAGNLRKWKSGQVLTKNLSLSGETVQLSAMLEENRGDYCIIRFAWAPASFRWSAVLDAAGEAPLPPYIRRKAEAEDKARYQTIYARNEGAVAAPTAGLHFTGPVLEDIRKRGIASHPITLHTGLGTFRPVTTENPFDHTIHREMIVADREVIQFIKAHAGNLVMVGTTSLRAAESLYWTGVYLLEGHAPEMPFELLPGFVHARMDKENPTPEEALNALLLYMQQHAWKTLSVNTGLFILPGYTFKLCKGLITNFHLPKSTLLMLVAAFIGNDWHNVYEEALKKNYRFLSYGDGSLLLPRT